MHRALVVLTMLVALGTPAWAVAQEPAGQAAATRSSSPTVNLNSATVQQLEELPGVGPRTAQRIVEYRQKNGPFKKVEDLMNIQGIGEKNFLKLKPLVTVTAPKTDKPAGPER